MKVFLSFFGRIGEYNLDLIAPSTARYHCMYLKRDVKHAVLSLKVLAMSFKDGA